jgi:V/A-type H+-transporting ATPase subunit E
MGCRELIEALRSSGDERIRELRAGAEQEAAGIRADGARRIAALRAEQARKRAAIAAEESVKRLFEADEKARRTLLSARRDLAQRLYGLAAASLPSLRNVGYADVFRSFAGELPRLKWRTVRVNPADARLAEEHFPDAEIVSDGGITGGFEAISEGGELRVVNTFEKRLERSWEDMLPEIMREAMALLPGAGRDAPGEREAPDADRPSCAPAPSM